MGQATARGIVVGLLGTPTRGPLFEELHLFTPLGPHTC